MLTTISFEIRKNMRLDYLSERGKMPETSIAEFNIHYVEQGSGEPLLIFTDNVH
jgi:hypothetical protein